MSGTDLPGAAAGVAAALSTPLEFKVRYTLWEYIVFMWQHAGFLIRRRRLGAIQGNWMNIKTTFCAAAHFVLQQRSSRVYEFTIDAHGIVRSSGTGVTLVPWTDVSAIRRYSRGYMLVLKRGTLPIPFRCLNSGQSDTMNGFVLALRDARHH